MPRIKLNALWNFAEVVVSSAVLFVLYKLILATLGVSALGVWSLVLATTSLGRFADIGVAGGLGRYVALSQARGRSDEKTLVYVETALLVNITLYVLLAGLLYWPANWGLGFVTHGAATVEARRLLPYAICSFAAMNIANVAPAALIGLHVSYQKSMVAILTMLAQLAIAAVMIKPFGLRAIALAQIGQYIILGVLTWLATVRTVSGRWRLAAPHRISLAALRELMGFGLRLQALNLIAFPFEAITKFVFSAVGGLPALGLYEVASRGILQIRQLVVAPSQNLTPLFAAENEGGRLRLKTIYDGATTHIVAAGALAMAVMGLGSPLISVIWLGHVDRMFVTYSLILAAGWFCNIASTPGYFLGLGVGLLRWNIAGTTCTTVSTGFLAGGLGLLMGPPGLAIGAMIALSVGGLLTWAMNCRALALPIWPDGEAWRRLGRSILRVRRIIDQSDGAPKQALGLSGQAAVTSATISQKAQDQLSVQAPES